MSWNIEGIGTKEAVRKQVSEYLGGMAERSKGSSNEVEYRAANSAVSAMIESIPDGDGLVKIKAWGSVGYDKGNPFFNCKIEIDLLVPTIK